MLSTILFLTASTSEDMPTQVPEPACLLPFGHATFVERTLESLARAGIKKVELVVCDKPEAFRAILQDGWQWGIELTWHLAFDPTTPYDIISRLAKSTQGRLLIGHAQSWIDADMVRELIQSNRVAMTQDQQWCGWVSADCDKARDLSPYIYENGLSLQVANWDNERQLVVPYEKYANANSAASLMDAQYIAFSQMDLVPATWIRHDWGAASPDANIHPQASITGPVLIGPRSSIGRGAQVGPGVLISSDVLVSGGAVLKHAVILPDTYISSSVNVENLLVQGNTFSDLKRQIKFQLPDHEGLLNYLSPPKKGLTPWHSRLWAVLCLIMFFPAIPMLMIWQKINGRNQPWMYKECVKGKDNKQKLIISALRTRVPNSGFSGSLLGIYGGMLDICQGRRQWLGIRARNTAEWYGLRKQWQSLFNQEPIGLLNAPEWCDPSHPNQEAAAAADAYLVIKSSWRERLAILSDILSLFNLSKMIRDARTQ